MGLAAIYRSQGFTATEKRLLKRCERSFLNYWSYANLFRNDHGAKELVDVLVCCGPYLILFSDKSCEFDIEKPPNIGWRRWYRKAIARSKSQLIGAEKFVNDHPEQIYLDSSLTARIPLQIPHASERKTFLVCVANGAGRACRSYFGSARGSLVLTNDPAEEMPFFVGDINPRGPYIHVLDDNTFDTVLSEFDTITDFAMYLEEKERILRTYGTMMFHGEEEAVALYLRGFDEIEGRYKLDSVPKRHQLDIEHSAVCFEEGFWDSLRRHPQYIRRQKENRISYLWDTLIKRFTDHMIRGTSTRYGDVSRDQHEGGIRYMALEPRTHRRLLSQQLLNSIESYAADKNFAARTMLPESVPNGTNSGYVFIQYSRDFEVTREEYEEYRARRSTLLHAYCLAARQKFPGPDRIIGIATEPPKLFSNALTSEEMLVIDRKKLTDGEVADVSEILSRFNFFHPSKSTGGRATVNDFPDL